MSREFHSKPLLLGVVGIMAVLAACGATPQASHQKTAFGAAAHGHAAKARAIKREALKERAPSRPNTGAAADTTDGQVKNVWAAFGTSVRPAAAIQPVTSQVAYKVDGQGAAPHLDGNLSAGPAGTAFAWPGTGVSQSTDGGRTWQPRISLHDGVWGVDFLSASQGWVVGVDQLWRTEDGATTWRQLREPIGAPLVKVSFSSSVTGFGLTTTGTAVTTTDGGLSWTAVHVAPVATDFCFLNSKIGFLMTDTGSVDKTADGGHTWAGDNPVSFKSKNGVLAWNTIACKVDTVLASTTILDPQSPVDQAYVVNETRNAGKSWSTVASRSLDGNVTVPKAASPVDNLAAISLDASGSPVFVGMSDASFGISVVRLNQGVQEKESVPKIPARQAAPKSGLGYVEVHGVAFGSGLALIDLDDDALGAPDTPLDQSIVLTNLGGSWGHASASLATPPPPLRFGTQVPVPNPAAKATIRHDAKRTTR